KLDRNFIIESIYKQKMPNRFLAQFTYFLKENIENEYVFRLINKNFDDFLSIYLPLLPVQSKDFPLHFVGSIAYYFQDILKNCVEKHHYLVGNIAQNPIEGLKKYHHLST
ncbi:MAG: N-acetylglucosamine kinase, partial [Bacteroidetes bacterium]